MQLRAIWLRMPSVEDIYNLSQKHDKIQMQRSSF